jgi:hypothetical protein
MASPSTSVELRFSKKVAVQCTNHPFVKAFANFTGRLPVTHQQLTMILENEPYGALPLVELSFDENRLNFSFGADGRTVNKTSHSTRAETSNIGVVEERTLN